MGWVREVGWVGWVGEGNARVMQGLHDSIQNLVITPPNPQKPEVITQNYNPPKPKRLIVERILRMHIFPAFSSKNCLFRCSISLCFLLRSIFDIFLTFFLKKKKKSFRQKCQAKGTWGQKCPILAPVSGTKLPKTEGSYHRGQLS